MACDLVTTTSVPLDEPSQVGFTPDDVIALALGSTTLPLGWLSPVVDVDGNLLDYTTRSSTEVSLSVELESIEARLVERVDSATGLRCPDSLEVDAAAALTTADGALAEQFSGVLELRTGLARLHAEVPLEALSGGFAFDPPELDGLAPSALLFDVDFTRYGQAGSIQEKYEENMGRQVAEWPLDRICRFTAGLTPVLDEQERPSVQDLFQTVRAVTGRTLTLREFDPEGDVSFVVAGPVPLDLEISGAPETACFSPPPFSYYSYGVLDELTVSAQLTLSSELLPAPVRLPILLFGNFDPGAETLDNVGLSVLFEPCGSGGPDYYSPEDFVANCGDWGLDLSAYNLVIIDVTYPSLLSGGSTTLSIIGLTADDGEIVREFEVFSPSPE